MPSASSMAELERMLMAQMQKAMNVVSEKVKADMYEHTGEFYTQGKPELYVRTGGLGDSPRTTSLKKSGNEVSFEAYLEPPSYKVPNPVFTERHLPSRYSGSEVLGAAEVGQAGILGKPGFWKRSLDDMKKELQSTIPQFFT